MNRTAIIIVSLLVFLTAGQGLFGEERAADPKTEAGECVKNYDPAVDYFPEKAGLEHARGFSIDYFSNYKVIKVLNPWRNSRTTFTYLLVQCGTPVPDGFEGATVVEIPVRRVVTLSTTTLPVFDQLGLLDRLVGIGDFKLIYNPKILNLIRHGKLEEIGWNENINVERLVSLNPDVMITYGVNNPARDRFAKLRELEIKVVVDAGYMENTPLGRAEWIKFFAAFFNREKQAERLFADIDKQYKKYRRLARHVRNKPVVFTGNNFKGLWYMPGGRSYFAAFLRDAGTRYLWADDQSTGSLHLDFEYVLEKSYKADYWLHPGNSRSVEEVVALDSRYKYFPALANGRTYNNTARMSRGGGNDFWETGFANPHLILADLIRIFHPELLPDHELIWYRKLE
ncbi:MAG: ABC transporter substrate-binding protein [Proteobacteria bacterium]|nr:ABC transporter substrate-binding protein [Pseudomonadota bacterium]